MCGAKSTIHHCYLYLWPTSQYSTFWKLQFPENFLCTTVISGFWSYQEQLLTNISLSPAHAAVVMWVSHSGMRWTFCGGLLAWHQCWFNVPEGIKTMLLQVWQQKFRTSTPKYVALIKWFFWAPETWKPANARKGFLWTSSFFVLKTSSLIPQRN